MDEPRVIAAQVASSLQMLAARTRSHKSLSMLTYLIEMALAEAGQQAGGKPAARSERRKGRSPRMAFRRSRARR